MRSQIWKVKNDDIYFLTQKTTFIRQPSMNFDHYSYKYQNNNVFPPSFTINLSPTYYLRAAAIQYPNIPINTRTSNKFAHPYFSSKKQTKEKGTPF